MTTLAKDDEYSRDLRDQRQKHFVKAPSKEEVERVIRQMTFEEFHAGCDGSSFAPKDASGSISTVTGCNGGFPVGSVVVYTPPSEEKINSSEALKLKLSGVYGKSMLDNKGLPLAELDSMKLATTVLSSKHMAKSEPDYYGDFCNLGQKKRLGKKPSGLVSKLLTRL